MTVDFSVEGGVARVTLNRPERRNAVDAETESELNNIWRAIEADSSVRCVVLTGAGDKAFCAGADMKSDTGMSGLEYWAASRDNGFGGIAMRQNLSVPVIARVNGIAVGGGMEMVLGCDIVIASENARFGLPEARVGRLPLDGGMVLLQRYLPQKIALGMMLTGRLMDSQEAADYGLVNARVPHDQLDAEVDAWTSDLLACAPLSLAAIKTTVYQTSHLSPADAQKLKTTALVAALVSEDSNEGVRAFREKRAPVWQGK